MPWPTDPKESDTERETCSSKEKEKKKKKKTAVHKVLLFNETNPKDVQSGSSCAVHKHGENKQTKRQSSGQSELTQNQAGLATRGISPGWHWCRGHWAGHRSSGHRLLFALPQAGLEVCVHIFMNVTFSLQI
jgi:hypothetical protein